MNLPLISGCAEQIAAKKLQKYIFPPQSDNSCLLWQSLTNGFYPIKRKIRNLITLPLIRVLIQAHQAGLSTSSTNL